MIAAHHPLLEVKRLLDTIVAHADVQRLEQCLSGQLLPALGGDQHPADLLYQALTLPPFAHDQAIALGDLSAEVCKRQRELPDGPAADRPRQKTESNPVVWLAPKHSSDWEREYLLFNLFLFATWLPANAALFAELKHLLESPPKSTSAPGRQERTYRQLHQALIVQQTDASLELSWLGIIESNPNHVGSFSAAQRQELLDAWRGLLWVPPSPAQQKRGETLSIERAEQGLLALYRSIENSPDSIRLLRHAVRMLADAYPRSPQFWSERLAGLMAGWPELLPTGVLHRGCQQSLPTQ